MAGLPDQNSDSFRFKFRARAKESVRFTFRVRAKEFVALSRYTAEFKTFISSAPLLEKVLLSREESVSTFSTQLKELQPKRDSN